MEDSNSLSDSNSAACVPLERIKETKLCVVIMSSIKLIAIIGNPARSASVHDDEGSTRV